ncbi:presenilin-1 [Wolffia australiana]
MESTLLDALGGEIVSVMAPVSISMLLVVLLVSSLASPSPELAPSPAMAGLLLFPETPSSSPSAKLQSALLNALAFVAMIAALTFLLLLLFYLRCTAFLKTYTRFSAFFVLASMGGSILLTLIQRLSLPLDAASVALFLLNFSVLGVVSVMNSAVPILLKQGYMVVLGIIVAAWFTKLPEWTTWALLIALSGYDLVAVLAPGGPLKLLVELASSREEELPALVYEARPRVSASVELQPAARVSAIEVVNLEAEIVESSRSEFEIEQILEERSPLVRSPGVEQSEIVETTRGIKLGLGDFVFYSVLVGRAALYDLMTVYACYLAVISGLGCTLVLLSVCRRALPALPISITLGVIFYFLTRLLMEPFVVGISSQLIML